MFKRFFQLLQHQLLCGSLVPIPNYENISTPTILFHSGNTDYDKGHNDKRNVSGLGDYHWHHALPPHLHIGGNCIYRNEPPCNLSPDEDCNIEQPYTPLLVYQSARRSGLDEYSNTARDMGCGTYSLDMLEEERGIKKEQVAACVEQNDSILFDSFINLAQCCSIGEM